MRRKRREIATFEKSDGTAEQIMLPEGCRALDLDRVNEDDEKVLVELSMNGRRTRYFFAKAHLSSAVRRLKSRKMIEAIRDENNNYSYDLTRFGQMWVDRYAAGTKNMDVTDYRKKKGYTSAFV